MRCAAWASIPTVIARRCARKVRAAGEQVAARGGVSVSYEVVGDAPPCDMPPDIRAAIEAAATELGIPFVPIVSGAGHDSQVMATRVPTAMLFVPSQDGRSHSAAEYTTPEDA